MSVSLSSTSSTHVTEPVIAEMLDLKSQWQELQKDWDLRIDSLVEIWLDFCANNELREIHLLRPVFKDSLQNELWALAEEFAAELRIAVQRDGNHPIDPRFLQNIPQYDMTQQNSVEIIRFEEIDNN